MILHRLQKETLDASRIVLTEGGVVERIRRHRSVSLDPLIANAGLVYDPRGRGIMGAIYRDYIAVGRRCALPFLVLAPTWRANPERIARSAFSGKETIVRDNVDFLVSIRAEFGEYAASVFLGGLMGCRGDAYRPEQSLSAAAAAAYHPPQAEALAGSGVDFIIASTLPAAAEARGMARALAGCGVPYILSFVIRPDGSLLDGTPLTDAVSGIDDASDRPPLGYMVNCVHPTVFARAMDSEAARGEGPGARLLGLQANTSTKSPEELDGLASLDTSEPEEFAEAMIALHRRFGIRILGGCCGTDARHIDAIAFKSTRCDAGLPWPPARCR